MLVFAAYSINVAYMQLTRTQLRTATDAASRAGARKLSISQDPDKARNKAIDAAKKNVVAGAPLILRDSDVQFGMSQPGSGGGRWQFVEATSPGDPMNSMRVFGKRTIGSASGGIPMIFPGLASSGIFQPQKSATATQIDRDITLVLDRSGSMAQAVQDGATIDPWSSGDPAPDGSKWDALVQAVDAFLAALSSTPQDEQVALVTYATSASHELHLSLNYSQVQTRMGEYTDHFNGGRTAVGDGAELGARAVLHPDYARRYAQKTIVVMTDGIHNEGKYPDVVAKYAHDNYNVTVHTITFGSGANQTLMQKTADDGGGKHWHADTTQSLIAAFEEIANNLPTLITE